MGSRKSVALIIETSTHYGREILTGVLRYRTEKTDWRVLLEERDLNSPPPWLDSWRGDGVISRLSTPEVLDKFVSERVPYIELTDRQSERDDVVTFHADDRAIGEMAAQHFIERGFQQLAFVGAMNEAWCVRRHKSIVEISQSHGIGCHLHESRLGYQPGDHEKLIQWLASLPKPVGIIGGNDALAKYVLDACLLSGIDVPEQVAVLGVDNDELTCKFCEPTLSSVITSAEAMGYRSAEALDRLMNGRSVQQKLQLMQPWDVKLRQSTDTIAIEDPDMAQAMVFIRNNACQGISVDDVLATTRMSRSSLERRARRLLGMSPQQQIRLAQLKRVKYLLAETDLLIEEIGKQCGFEHPEYLHVMFKREFQITPGEYRKSVRR